jgi:hypothetical protein
MQARRIVKIIGKTITTTGETDLITVEEYGLY